MLEVGVPFSDPLADGPVIQRATERALAAGGSLRASLSLIEQVRPDVAAPIVVFSYANPILRMGMEAFARRAAAAGVDAVLALDLPIEEAGEFRSTLKAAGLDVFLLSPTTTDARIQKRWNWAAGFCTDFAAGRDRRARKCRKRRRSAGADSRAPRRCRLRWVRISRPERRRSRRYADAAVVSSALVSKIARAHRRI